MARPHMCATDHPPLNLDKNGMPKDYAAYMWLTYGKTITDHSPNHLAFTDKTRRPRLGVRTTK